MYPELLSFFAHMLTCLPLPDGHLTRLTEAPGRQYPSRGVLTYGTVRQAADTSCDCTTDQSRSRKRGRLVSQRSERAKNHRMVAGNSLDGRAFAWTLCYRRTKRSEDGESRMQWSPIRACEVMLPRKGQKEEGGRAQRSAAGQPGLVHMKKRF